MRVILAMGALFLCIGSLVAQEKGDPGLRLQVSEEDGGSVAVRTESGFLNQDSSLKRSWFVIDDLNAPAGLDHAGVFPRFEEKENAHYLQPVGMVSPREMISAVEVRYVLFDVWGQRLRTLAVTRLADSSTHIDLRASRSPALELEVSQLMTVVAFVARVRTAEGQVWTFEPKRIARRMESLGVVVSPAELVPDEQRMVSPGVMYWTYVPKQGDTTVKTGGVLRP